MKNLIKFFVIFIFFSFFTACKKDYTLPDTALSPNGSIENANSFGSSNFSSFVLFGPLGPIGCIPANRVRDIGGYFAVANQTSYPNNVITDFVSSGVNGKLGWNRTGSASSYYIDFSRGVTTTPSSDLSNALPAGISPPAGVSQAAHHIVSWATSRDSRITVSQQALIQLAARVGFHPNDDLNRIRLYSTLGTVGGVTYSYHGNAPTYDTYVKTVLDLYYSSANYNYKTPEKAYEFITCGLVPYLKTKLIEAQDISYSRFIDVREKIKGAPKPQTLNQVYSGWTTLPYDIPGYPK